MSKKELKGITLSELIENIKKYGYYVPYIPLFITPPIKKTKEDE